MAQGEDDTVISNPKQTRKEREAAEDTGQARGGPLEAPRRTPHREGAHGERAKALTAGHAVGQSAVDLPEELLVDRPEEESEELDGVYYEPRGDEHVTEDEMAQELRLQQPDEVHGARSLLSRQINTRRRILPEGKKAQHSGQRLEHKPMIRVTKNCLCF